MYKEYALWLKEQDGDKEIPLRYAAFKEFQDQSDDVAKKYKDLNKSQDSMAVWALKVQLVDFKTDTVKKIKTLCRIDTKNELEYYKNGGILQYVLRNMI